MFRRVVIGVIFGVVVYAGIVVWIDLDNLRAAVEGVPKWPVFAALGLSLVNYALRFLKWERYRTLLEIPLPRPTSFLIYLSGFSMGVTPGKMGEVLKSWMIRRCCGVRIHQSAPIVVAERITDLLGYLILVAIGGLASHPEYALAFWGTLAASVVALFLLGSPKFATLMTAVVGRLPVVGKLAHKVAGAFESSRVLLSPRNLIGPTLLSVLSWGCECVGFWLIADAFVEADISFLFAVFAYAISALLGAVAIFLPGGIGATEWSLGALTRREYELVGGLTLELARSKAAGVVLLIRFATLWFSVLIGVAALALFQRRYGSVDVSESDAE